MTGADNPATRLKRRLAALPDRLRARTNAALRQVGDAIVAEVRRVLGASAGTQPSVSGAPPRDPSGRIAEALTATLYETQAVVTIGAATPQAAFLEYGTRTMAARPFLRPSVDAVRPAALEVLRAALAAAVTEQGETPP